MKLMDRAAYGESDFARRARRDVEGKRARLGADTPAPGSLVRSVALRQAVVYAVIFCVSVTLLAGFFYWSTAAYLSGQAQDAIEAEAGALEERYRNFGLTGLTELIEERLAQQPAGPEIYLLVTPDYRRVVGNLSGWPEAETDAAGWARFRLGEQGPEGAEAVRWASAKMFNLTGGFRLLVGRDMQELEAMRATVTRTLLWGLGITVLMALAGGALMGRSMSNRIGEINRAIRRIMDGDLSQRMPGNQSGDEFDRLTDNLNLMLDRIEGLMHGVRQVSDNIAHDLKTPLARMHNRLEELQRRLGGDHPIGAEAARRMVEDAIREADALLGTFGALLRIARIEASARREAFTSVDLDALVGDVAELYEPLAEERGQRLEVTVSAAPAVRGDRDLLFQALANLVDNAIKYAPDGGRIRVTLRKEGDATVVSVIDNGPGVAPQDREHVFERFWRADDSRTTPGSGLGLSLVEAVAALHDGEVELDDAQPGLEVRLRLPAGVESTPE